MRFFSGLMNRFRMDRRGNVAVIFALACVPLISAVGCAVDYSEASRIKAKMQSAADAAAVAAISQNSQGWLASTAMTSNGEVTVAETDAKNIFTGNAPASSTLYNSEVVTATVMKTGPTLTSTVTFSASVPTTFMKVVGFSSLTVTGSSSATSSLPLYLDFYVMLDVSGSMGLPSTNAEQSRLALVNPDDFDVYPKGCTLACHFQASNACTNPPIGQKTIPNPTSNSPVYQAYPTSNLGPSTINPVTGAVTTKGGYCLGYLISRVSQSGYQALINSAVTTQSQTQYPMKNGQQLPPNILAGVTSSLTGPNALLTGNSSSQTNSLTAVTSCPVDGTDACIQLRADAVGTALNATVQTQGVDGLFAVANNPKNQQVTGQFRIGLYPFIQDLITYSGLTSTIGSGSPIQTAAQNLATLLDTGNTPNVGLGSGGTHFENAFPQLNAIIPPLSGGAVGDGSSSTDTKPFVFLVTDGSQNFQTCCNFSGSNSATVMPSGTSSPCQALKNRGITVAVLYIPYEPIQNPTPIFNNEDNVANANIPNIPPSLVSCASPNFFFQATSTSQIAQALSAMFNQSLAAAHITN
jgi:Flp pilus assembly protein TadG